MHVLHAWLFCKGFKLRALLAFVFLRHLVHMHVLLFWTRCHVWNTFLLLLQSVSTLEMGWEDPWSARRTWSSKDLLIVWRVKVLPTAKKKAYVRIIAGTTSSCLNCSSQAYINLLWKAIVNVWCIAPDISTRSNVRHKRRHKKAIV